MTFGEIKTIIEESLITSYVNENEFKKSLRAFKQNILNDKNISKIYSLYDDLSKPQNLNESEAKEFLNEGISLIQKILKTTKLPKTTTKKVENKYSELDTLVYNTSINLKERIDIRKKLVSVLVQKNDITENSVNLPIKTMVKIANQTISEYIEQLDESDKRTLLDVIKEDINLLEEKFTSLKESTINKLSLLLENNTEKDIEEKLNETINRVKSDSFSQLNYLKLLSLSNSI